MFKVLFTAVNINFLIKIKVTCVDLDSAGISCYNFLNRDRLGLKIEHFKCLEVFPWLPNSYCKTFL